MNVNMKKYCVILLLLTNYAQCHMPNVYEFCSYVVAHQGQVQGPQSFCDASTCQGRPGKRGNAGIPGTVGMKGNKGEHGVCDPSNLERVKDDFQKRWEMIPKSVYCLLGVKRHDVQDYAMTASSSLSPKYQPYFGRLDGVITSFPSGAWCSSSNNLGEWIQIDLRKSTSVAGVVTQGSNVPTNKWVTSFKVGCATNSGNRVTFVQEKGKEKIFVGNSDVGTKIFNLFPAPITCRFIRIYPLSWNNGLCMRLDLIHGNCHGRMNYRFQIRSAGANDGNVAWINVNGVDKAPNRRGYNVVVINSISLGLEQKSFDTYGGGARAFKDMTEYLKQVPYGSIIALAIRDANTKSLMQDTDVDVMEALGTGNDGCPTKVEFRDSWALITQKVMNGVQFPDWKNCSRSPRYAGDVTMEAVVDLGRFYDIDDIPMST